MKKKKSRIFSGIEPTNTMRLVVAKDSRDAKNLAVSIIVSVPCVMMILSASKR